MENKNEPAFPFVIPGSENSNDTYAPTGLTKREYFAGLAMQGLLACPASDLRDSSNIGIVKAAVDYADELLKQLNQQP